MTNKRFYLNLLGMALAILAPLVAFGIEFLGIEKNSREVTVVTSGEKKDHCRGEIFDSNTGQHIPEASMQNCTMFWNGREGVLWYGNGRLTGQTHYNLKLK